MLLERGYMEEIRLGIRRIREELASLNLPAPEFREDGFSFVITFRSIAPREGAVPPTDPFLALLERGEVSERQYRGLLYAREHESIARREYVALTGASDRTALRDLTGLVELGVLEIATGRGRSASYRLKGLIAP